MTLLQIVCDNCGAKYRLPETFNGAKAKCKQCNSAIDVAAQRAAAQAPAAAAAPAAARPARAGSPARPAPSPARSAAGARSSSVRAPRREAEAPPPSNKKPLIFAGIGGVAVIVVVAVLLNSGKQPAKSGPPTAQAPANATSNDGAKPAPSPAASKPADSQPPADASAKKRTADGPSAPAPLEPAAPAGQKPQGKSPDKQAPKPAAGTQTADTSSGVKSATSGAGASGKSDAQTDERTKLQQKELDAWMKLGTKTLAEVLDPKKVTQALEYPAEVTEDDKKKLAALYQEAKDNGGGARTGRALKEIGKMGVGGLYYLINQLREIDYKNYDDVVWAGQINLTLLELTLGVNTGFVPVEAGSDPTKLDPRIAQWDAMTVDRWISGCRGEKAQWSSKAKWDEYIANRKARKDKELEEGDKK